MHHTYATHLHLAHLAPAERAVVGPVADPIVVASAEDFVALRLLDARQRLCRLSDA